ncbi:ribonuclease III [Mycoplasmopsis primatum]|uniref:ribonuclease III n=1 Tax=Mycoplasmopsis primatum TaxID=55604 RepID=UPI00068D43E8|nr:ribonuclease III [Mycoplasmopsis primatum]
MNNKLISFLNKFNIKPKNFTIYQLAFTHASSSKNNRSKNYQTLEFLGDSIIQFCVSDFLYDFFKDKNQGQLTLIRSQLVSTKSLNKLTSKLGLKYFLRITSIHTTEDVINSKKVGADIFESLVAAIYLDSGLDKAYSFIIETILKDISIDKFDNDHLKDPKTALQEYMQAFSKKSVIYDTYDIGRYIFESKAILNNQIYGTGKGKSKLEAEENAAYSALKKLKIV